MSLHHSYRYKNSLFSIHFNQSVHLLPRTEAGSFLTPSKTLERAPDYSETFPL